MTLKGDELSDWSTVRQHPTSELSLILDLPRLFCPILTVSRYLCSEILAKSFQYMSSWSSQELDNLCQSAHSIPIMTEKTAWNSLDRFRYPPLLDNQFRLFRILREDDGPTIKFSLQTYAIDKAPAYVALSYCWGEGPANIECGCNDGSAIFITNTLYAALTQSPADSDSYWWVDQISIDQSSAADKAQQIPNMGKIYSGAYVVIIWLGVADEDTHLAFRALLDVRDQIAASMDQDVTWDTPYHQIDKERFAETLVLSTSDHPEWIAVRKMLARPWFQRTWTLQEFVLARHAFLTCGSHGMLYSQAALVFYCVTILDQQHMFGPSCDEVINMSFLRRYENTYDLGDMLKVTMARHAGLPHDKIYGILGMIERPGPNLDHLQIDYTIPFQSLFTHVTKRLISSYRDLSILELKRIFPEADSLDQPGLPSWVPDYRCNYARTLIDRRANVAPMIYHFGDRFYYATGASKADKSVDDQPSLEVRGVKIGNLSVASNVSGNFTEATTIGRDLFPGGNWMLIAQTCALDSIYAITGEPFAEAYLRALIWDYLPEESNREAREDRGTFDASFPQPGSSRFYLEDGEYRVETDDEYDRMTAQILGGTIDRRLFVDGLGHIVIAHESCVLGDEVWLLLGADKPCILRPRDAGAYEFKGEAYVHGIMNGEYLVKNFKHLDTNSNNMNDYQWLASLEDTIPFGTKTIVLI